MRWRLSLVAAQAPPWEALHRLVWALHAGGEAEAEAFLARMPKRIEFIR